MGVRTPPEGWIVPPEPGTLNRSKLDTFLGMNGEHILSMDGTAGAFRAFASNSTNGTLLLMPGQALTNSLPADIYVEALGNGVTHFTYESFAESV